MNRLTAIIVIVGAAILGGLGAGLLRQSQLDNLAAQNAALRKQLQKAQAETKDALGRVAANKLEMENLRQDSFALAVLREQLKTNAPTLNAPPGFFAGPDQSIYLTYASPDPVLRSFLRWVMGGEGDSNTKARVIFQKICAACHQPNGEGKEGVAPPLAGSEWIKAPSGQRLVRIVLNGLNGPVQVQGKTWNLAMPPWRENLDDEQIAIVLNYIRSEWGGEGASPINESVVAEAREQSHPKPETSEELLRIEVK